MSVAPHSEPVDRSDARRSRRERILDAAREVAEQRGFSAVTMDAIAAAAQVSKGTLYNHFESKEGLLLDMVVEQFASGGDTVAAHIGASGDPRAILRGITDGLVAMADERRRAGSLLYQAWAVVAEDPAQRPPLEAALRTLFASWSDATRGVIERGQRAGVFRTDVEAAVVADAISAIVSGVLFRATFDADAASPERLRACFEALVHERLQFHDLAAGRSVPPTAPEPSGSGA